MKVEKPALRDEELIGLGLAALVHVTLIAVLVVQASQEVKTIDPPERMAVSLTDGTELANLSPAPGDERFAPGAPVESSIENVVPPAPMPDDPVVDPETSSSAPSNPTPSPRQTRAPEQKKLDPKKTTGSQSGGASPSRNTGEKKETGFSGAFGGVSSQSTAAAKRNINVSISSQVLPKWNRCRISGLDVDKLRVTVDFRMDASGNVSNVRARPVQGVNASNRAQADRFSECAVRSIRLVRQFTGLPSDRHDLFSTYDFTFRKE